MVGRAPGLDMLDDALRRAAGEKHLALVAGEPGIGKTRLVSEFATRVHARGTVVLFGGASEALTSPYLPFAEALGHAVERAPAHLLRELQPDLAELAPVVPAAGRAEGTSAPSSTAGETGKYVFFAAVAELLRRLSVEAPLVVAIDDLHWVDEGSLRLLEYLLTGPGELSVLFVATLRATDVDATGSLPDALARFGVDRVSRVELTGLSSGETLSLLTDLVGQGLSGPEAELASRLHHETSGNPLFVTELVRSLVESDELVQEDGRWHLCHDLDEVRLPPSIAELVGLRLAVLGERASRALPVASLSGQEFDPELVERVLGEEDLGPVWDAAARAGLIAADDPGGLRFSHPLVRRAIRERLGAREAGGVHRRIAEALEGVTPAEPARLAHHWCEAIPSEPAKALAAAAAAGEEALERFDGDDAAAWYERALTLLPGTEAGRQRCECLLGLGVARRQIGASEFRETLLDAARQAEELEDRELLVRACLANSRGFVSSSGEVDDERIAMLEAALRAVGSEDSDERSLLLARVAVELTFSGQWERRLGLSEEALAMARRCGSRATLAQVLTERFVTIWMPETLGERQENSREAVALADELGDAWLQFHAIHWHAVGLLQGAAIGDAAAAAARQDELAERIGDPTMLWISTYDRANLAILAGRLAEAEALAQEAAEIATGSGQPDALPFLTSQLTNIRFEQGRLPELQPLIAEVVANNPGIPAFRAVLALAYTEGELREEAAGLLEVDLADEFAQMPADVTWLASHAIYAHVAAQLGERRAARVLYERLAPHAGQIVYTGISAWGNVDHALGVLAAVLGRHADGESHLRAAADTYRAIAAPIWLARCQLDTARLRLTRDEPDDREGAMRLLDEARVAARRHGAATVERRAGSLRDHALAMDVVAGGGHSAQRLRLGSRPRDRREATVAPGSGERPNAVLECTGDYWTVSHGGSEVRLRDSKGIRYLARLISQPGVELHAADLQHGSRDIRPASDGQGGDTLDVRRVGAGDAGAVLDEEAKRQYRGRVEQLEDEIEEGERFNDPERVAKAREEREALGRELAAGIGLGGRDRRAASEAERARVNVTRALRKALARIAERDPRLGGHLQAAVRTGTFCAYESPPGQELRWDVKGIDA